MSSSADRTRKTSARQGAEWVATAAAIATGTHAYAEVVRFENPQGPGQFYWPFDVLDVTRSADEQPGFGGLGGASTSYQAYFADFYPAFSYQTTYQSGGGMSIFSQGFSDRYAAPLDAGTLIGPGLTDGSFITGTVFEFEFDACDLVYVGYPCYCYYYENCTSGNRGIIPEGVETYLGVRFDLGAGPQYGWVKVVRNFVEIEALAWGFETEPGVPIRAGELPCSADVTGPGGGPDGVVGINDLLELLSNWGQAGNGAALAPPVDVVDTVDLLELLSQWGRCTSEKSASVLPPAGTLAALARGSAGPR